MIDLFGKTLGKPSMELGDCLIDSTPDTPQNILWNNRKTTKGTDSYDHDHDHPKKEIQ